MRKKYLRTELNQLSNSQLIGVIIDLQNDLRSYDDLIAATTKYRLGITQLKKHIEKVLQRTKNLEDIKPGMII